MSDRAGFLRRIRSAAARIEDPGLPATFPFTSASGRPEDGVELFLERLGRVAGVGRTVPRTDLATEVASVVRDVAGARVVVTADLAPFREEVDRGLASAGASAVEPAPDGWPEAARTADLGITSAVAAVAATGSVLLAPDAGSPRAASLLPPAHLVVLDAARVVPGIEEAMEIVGGLALRRSSTVLVTGPSRTSDIEMTTVFGAHGPRTLHVLLVQELE